MDYVGMISVFVGQDGKEQIAVSFLNVKMIVH